MNNTIRPAAIAGQFYPANAIEIDHMVKTFLDDVKDVPPPSKAIIAPHAGLIYSGPVAATAYSSLLAVKNKIRRVVLLGPSHRVYLKGMALCSADHYQTPLGNVEIDKAAYQSIQHLPQVNTTDEAHAQEHSLEIHLPFLQLILSSFKLIPIVVGETSPEDVAEVLETLWGDEETQIIISSDLSHFHNYETAKEIDASTSEAIENLDIASIGSKQACGCMPMRGLLHLAKEKNMSVKMLDLRNSGDTSGSKDRVVGYGAYSVSENSETKTKNENSANYTEEQEHTLLKIARSSIQHGFSNGKAETLNLDEYDNDLNSKRATFVTLKINDALRGCIGTLEARYPLAQSVAEYAFSAAFRDPRFEPLTEEEFQKITLSISILTPNEPIVFESDTDLIQQLKPHEDGLIIKAGNRSATFLPSVWESLPKPESFLAHLKAKAQIAPNENLSSASRYKAIEISKDNS